MEIHLDAQPFASIAADAVVTYAFDNPERIEGVVAEINTAMGGKLEPLAKTGELSGKSLEMVLVHYPQGLKAQRLLLVGAGKSEKFVTGDLRKIAGSALRYLKSRGVKKFAFVLREQDRNAASAQAVAEGLLVANFESDTYRSKKDHVKSIDSVILAGFDAAAQKDLEAAVAKGHVIADSQNFARELINEPSNKLTRSILAHRAEAMAKAVGLDVEILDEKRIAELEDGRAPERFAGWSRTAAGDRSEIHSGQCAEGLADARPGRQSRHFRYRRNFHQARRRHGEDEVRHGRRRRHARRDARDGCSEAFDSGDLRRALHRKYARRHRAKARRYSDRDVRKND